MRLSSHFKDKSSHASLSKELKSWLSTIPTLNEEALVSGEFNETGYLDHEALSTKLNIWSPLRISSSEDLLTTIEESEDFDEISYPISIPQKLLNFASTCDSLGSPISSSPFLPGNLSNDTKLFMQPLPSNSEVEDLTKSFVPSDDELDTEFLKKTLQKFSMKLNKSGNILFTPPDISTGLGKKKCKRDLVSLTAFIVEHLPMMLYKGELYCFERPRWKKLDQIACSKYLRDYFMQHDELYSVLTSADYKALYQELLIVSEIERDDDITPPRHLLNLRDSVLNLETMTFLPTSPEHGFFNYLDLYKSDLEDPAYGQHFENWISNISNGSPIVRTQILEMIAIAITGLELKHFYVLLGPPHTGKSQILRFLEQFLGPENAVCISEINKLGEKFGLSSFEGKLIATCHDIPNTSLSSSAVGVLKQCVGDDPIQTEAKYKNSKTLFRKPTMIFAGNYPIKIDNISREDALLERMVIIPFENTVTSEERIFKLYEKFLEEAPYIVRQAIDAYRDLAARNFQVTRSEVPTIYQPADGRELLNNVRAFIDEHCVLNSSSEVKTKDLYHAYLHHSSSDIKYTPFGRCLSEVLADYPEVKKLNRIGDSDQKGYQGIQLLADTD